MSFFSKNKSNMINSSHNGAIDNQWGPVVRGWATSADVNQPVWVCIVGDGEAKLVEANSFRSDLKANGVHPTGECGFSVDFGKRLTKPVEVTIIKKEFELSMSRPDFQNKPIFFMHIAKTAGSSLNDFFIQHYGKNLASMHIEAVTDWASLSKHRFISGHVSYQKALQKLELDNYVKVTFVRNPVEQLVSHLNWVRHLAEPEKRDFLNTHPPIIKDIANKLSKVDFSSLKEVKHLVSNLKPVELSLFDNAQSRYFYQTKQAGDKYQKSDCEQALINMKKFDLIGLTDDFDNEVAKLCKIAGIVKEWDQTKKVNVNKFDYGFDRSNPELLDVIRPLIEHDLTLYEAVKNKTYL